MKTVPNLRKLAAYDAYTFLMKELEKIDDVILEPLASTEWPRDMPVITGGGLVENVSTYDVTYASSGLDGENNLLFENANDIPVVQADFNKLIARCFNWAEYMSFSLLEREKMKGIGRDPQTFLDKGIRLHFDKSIDKSVYKGFTNVGSVGLVNSIVVTRSVAPNGAGGSSTWALKTADEILKDINTIITGIWTANDCDHDALPNHILIPPTQFGLLVTRKVSDDASVSILEYVLKNNISAQQGVDLTIEPCKWCTQAGTGNKDRMVAYMNRVDRICFNLTQPLTRMDPENYNMQVKIPYIGQFSEVRFLYPTTVRYLDGI